MNLAEFETKIGYTFKSKKLLETALTHSSYAREHNMGNYKCNERMEFLGDAYLDAIAGLALFEQMPHVREGVLSKTRSLVVCEDSLAEVGRKIDIGSYLLLGVGEDKSGGRKKKSIIADSTEALIGAIFLDGGYYAASDFVLKEFRKILRDAAGGKLVSDYKTTLQEILQQDGKMHEIVYRIDKTEGPDHDKVFFVTLVLEGREMGSGKGKTKKEAEQKAAKMTMEGGYLD
ncbi:MAG: ribonuclease III [Eubacterium sp.]|nr:ribonuclease III [Eubacterium sp.]